VNIEQGKHQDSATSQVKSSEVRKPRSGKKGKDMSKSKVSPQTSKTTSQGQLPTVSVAPVQQPRISTVREFPQDAPMPSSEFQSPETSLPAKPAPSGSTASEPAENKNASRGGRGRGRFRPHGVYRAGRGRGAGRGTVADAHSAPNGGGN
jgi:hypothetical protein